MGWSEREIRKLSQWAQDYIHAALAAAYLEQNPGDVGEGTDTVKAHAAPCDIVIHSIRRRLADSDGLSGKAVIDGIVQAKLLISDSPAHVRSVRFSQETGKVEKTVVSLTFDGVV